jgi:hypothetical protein
MGGMGASGKGVAWVGPAAVVLAGALALAPAIVLAAKTISLAGVPHFSALTDARKSCGKDTVVWANLKTDVYHLSASRWFGKTKKGAYFCESAVKKAGVRAAKE